MQNQIRKERQRQGFSQQRLAELAHVTIKTVQDVESGKSEPRITTAHRFARALGVSLLDLFDDTAA